MFDLHVCWCTMCLQRPEEGIRSLGTGILVDCEPQCECWETEALASARAVVVCKMGLKYMP